MATLRRHHEGWTRRNPLQPCCLEPIFKSNYEFSERQPRRYMQATKWALASDLNSDGLLFLSREIWCHKKRHESVVFIVDLDTVNDCFWPKAALNFMPISLV